MSEVGVEWSQEAGVGLSVESEELRAQSGLRSGARAGVRVESRVESEWSQSEMKPGRSGGTE
jgi:hypothetical protein